MNALKPVIEMSNLDFVKCYFEILPQVKTKKMAFERANNLHKELLGIYKYNTHKEFITALMD